MITPHEQNRFTELLDTQLDLVIKRWKETYESLPDKDDPFFSVNDLAYYIVMMGTRLSFLDDEKADITINAHIRSFDNIWNFLITFFVTYKPSEESDSFDDVTEGVVRSSFDEVKEWLKNDKKLTLQPF